MGEDADTSCLAQPVSVNSIGVCPAASFAVLTKVERVVVFQELFVALHVSLSPVLLLAG